MEVETDDIPEFCSNFGLDSNVRVRRLQVVTLPDRDRVARDADFLPCWANASVPVAAGSLTMICSTVSMGTHGLVPVLLCRSCRQAGVLEGPRPRLTHLADVQSFATSSKETPSEHLGAKLSRFELVLELPAKNSLDVQPAVSLRTVIGRAMPHTIASNHHY